MTMETVTPASGSLDPAVVMADLQLRLLQGLKKSKSSKSSYSFSVQGGKLTLSLDVLARVEMNHQITGGGRGSRKRRRVRRSEARDTASSVASTSDDSVTLPKPAKAISTFQEMKSSTEKIITDAVMSSIEIATSGYSSDKSKGRCRVKGKDDLITKARDFLKKNSNGAIDKDLHGEPWFYGSISEQETTDLMASHAKTGDFIIREDFAGGFVLSVQNRNLEHPLQGQLETYHFKIQTDDGKYLFSDSKFASLADYVEHLLRIGLIQKPLGNKQQHQKESQQRYRGKIQTRIMCHFCKQYHGPIHYCNISLCFMHYDHINMILLRGTKRESVERLPGYHVDDARMIHYKTKFDMDRVLMNEAESVRGKREEERTIWEKMMKDYKEMKERKEVEKLKRKREKEMEKIEEMKKEGLRFYSKQKKRVHFDVEQLTLGL